MTKTLADAKVGDTITLSGVVRSNAHDDRDHLIYIDFPGCSYAKGITPGTHVDQIIPKPWEPAVGDNVKYRNGTITHEVRGFVDDQIGVLSPSGTYYLAKKDQLICAD